MHGSETKEQLIVQQFEIGDHKNFIYLVYCPVTKDAALVDTQDDLEPVDQIIRSQKLKLKSILYTHTHWDHIAGLESLWDNYPELIVHVHQKEIHRFKKEIQNDTRIQPFLGGEKISLGNFQIEVLHTPGHSAGGTCFYLLGNPSVLLSGDTLFIRDVGRTDFPTGSNSEMFDSIQKIKKLPASTILYPGHHYAKECHSTLKEEFELSAPFKCKTVSELEALP